VASLLAGNLSAVGTAGRERVKRAVCLANLKQMAQAWLLYADDNDDKIVNGEAEYGTPGTCTTPAWGHHAKEKWWVGTDCHPSYQVGKNHPREVQIQAIRAGALFRYTGDENLYHCPAGIAGSVRTYSIVDAMNGLYRDGTRTGGSGVKVGETVLWVKKTTEIVIPGPAERLVLVDEGRVTPDSCGVHYLHPRWWDPPCVRHGAGTNVSFADGHGEHWKWEGAETITAGLAGIHQYEPTTPEGKRDLRRMQTAVWGRIGY
jgi:prepilin-type processing-associated H-X9-DG protein